MQDGATGARTDSSPRHLVLVGGGHAHVHVLAGFAMKRVAGARVTVISPGAKTAYSGMVPGVIAGLYEPEDCQIDVAALSARAGAAFLADRVVALDPERRTIEAERSGTIAYNILSLDVGSQPLDVARVRDLPNVVPVKPIEACAARVARFAADAAAGRVAPSAVVVGGGAGGVEVAFALRRRLAGVRAGTVAIVERSESLLPGGSLRIRRLVTRLAARYGIDLLLGCENPSIDERGVHLGERGRRDAALVVWATGAEGLGFLTRSGLPVDARGFLLVDEALRSVARPDVFAAGDCARMQEHPAMPRAGVYAVRQGPPLAHNLRVAVTARGRLTTYRPQSGFLSLLSTGDRRAALSYRGRAAHGRWCWWLKDWIDRRFVARYAPPRAERVRSPAEAAMPPGAMECGGCAAKLPAEALGDLLRVLPRTTAAGVAVGLDAPDDAAVLAHPEGRDLVATLDAFPPFLDDLHAVGEIAAVNAASDVFAMGGEPTAALVLAGSDAAPGAARDADLALLMRGAARGLERMGIALVGGHTLASGTSLIGLAVFGQVERGQALRKAGARVGDRLVLTKPLGTAVILAATRAGECPAEWTEAALAAMRLSNAVAARALRAAHATACTDVSGFGLLGHLREMLRAGGVAARVEVASVPALPGAVALLRAGWRSSAHAANAAFLGGIRRSPALDEAALALLCDPQTSGGLLAAVPPPACDELVRRLTAERLGAAVIGEIVPGSPDDLELAQSNRVA